SLSNGFDHFLGRIGHRLAAENRKTRVPQDSLPNFDVVAFQTDYQRQGQPGLLGRGHNPRGDDVALHNSAEDIHQDSTHIGVAQYNLKSGGDLFFAGAATDVEEVGRSATEVLDDIHGRHGQARAVHQASNVPVQLDVIEAVLGGFDFQWGFF